MFSNIPSLSKCKSLICKEDFHGVISNYNSLPIYRRLFMKKKKRLELQAIYLTALANLNKQETLVEEKESILEIYNERLIHNYLLLNSFAIEHLDILPTKQMIEAQQALLAFKKIPPVEDLWESLPIGSTIAVIGNAPTTRDLGHEIDQCDYVLRFNNYKISGFEKHVGTRTDFWCATCSIENVTEEHSNTIKIIIPDNPLLFPVNSYFIQEIQNPHRSFYYLPQAQILSLFNQLKSPPSSGVRILVSLQNIAKKRKITIKPFGFAFLSDQKTLKFDHYFESKSQKKERFHNINSEISLLQSIFKH